MQLHKVIRPFEGERPFIPGEIVDVDGWRYARSLVERRYIRPVTDSELAQATAPVEAGAAPTRRGRPSNAE